MDETMKNTTEDLVEQSVPTDEGVVAPDQENSVDPLKEAVEEQLKKIQRQNLLIGAQTACTMVLNKIAAAMSQPGKRTMNDYKRLVKDIESFCRTGLSRKINADGETEPIEEETTVDESVDAETVQN